MNSAEVAKFADGSLSTGVVGHYTQLVWADSDAIGCAFVSKHGWGMVRNG